MHPPGRRKSVWVATTPSTDFPSLAEDLAVDVAVIGGGITALTAACELKQSGFTVAVVERGAVAVAQSGSTTGHLTEVPDARYRHLVSRFGIEGARLVAASLRLAVDQVESIVSGRDIGCGFRRVAGHLFAEDADGRAVIDEELRFARKAGVDATFVDHTPLPFPTRGALMVPHQAQFHPRQYLLALAHSIPGRDSYVFESTTAVDVVEGEPCHVVTSQARITARDVIVATNAPSIGGVVAPPLRASRTHAIATRVRKQDGVEGLFWDTADPYHYIRGVPAARSAMLIVGGEDDRRLDPDADGDPHSRLERYMRERFTAGPASYKWSGQIVETEDGLPYIGRISPKSHVYIAAGYGGTGLTFGTLAGMILADLIAGRPNRYADVYSVTRSALMPEVDSFIA